MADTRERLTEWNGLKRGDACRIDGSSARATYTFSEFVRTEGGSEYVSVIEQKGNNGIRRARSFSPEKVFPF